MLSTILTKSAPARLLGLIFILVTPVIATAQVADGERENVDAATEAEANAAGGIASQAMVNAFREHCVMCHGADGVREGDVDLFALDAVADLKSHPELLEQLVVVLRDREMPPEDEGELPDELRSQMVQLLTGLAKEVQQSQPFLATPLRRMNRFQYNNAVVDLLQLDRDIFQLNERLMRRRVDYFDPASGAMPDEVKVSCRPLSKDIDNQRPEGFRGVAAFPQDQRAEHGFDNRADHLTLSPLLMESFLNLSQTITASPDVNAKECGVWEELFATPEETEPRTSNLATARERLRPILRRAFRRTVEDETVEEFVALANRELESGATFEAAMRTTVGAIIGMPDFIYFYEGGSESVSPESAGREPVSGFELASRLSQFFWSSIPDARLLDLAESGELADPEVLGGEIDRMLNDKRSARFCENFPSQWLQLDRLVTAIPDREQFSYFYYDGYRTSMHMMSEPLLLFETVFLEDRSIIELLAPDFTWESDMLAANYRGEVSNRREVQVQTFRRVKLEDPKRGGVITNAAIMTMTSTPVRTQPITRGAWMNAVIFNDPPEPPPADVPPLPESNAEELEKMTIRERLAAHRKRADCAGCHNRIDPLGFALENYGPTGVWRDTYENGRDVDPGGTLFNQFDFGTALEFKKLLIQEKGRFTRAFVAHLLSYGLGRELGPADQPTLDQIAEAAANGNDSLRTVMKGIAMSDSFLHKNTIGQD